MISKKDYLNIILVFKTRIDGIRILIANQNGIMGIGQDKEKLKTNLYSFNDTLRNVESEFKKKYGDKENDEK